MGHCILGIDIGTSKIGLGIIDIDNKVILKTQSLSIDPEIFFHNHVKKEMDIFALEDFLFSVVNGFIENNNAAIKGIGLTGQMHGVVGLDRTGKPVTNFVSWQDKRGDNKIKSKSIVDEIIDKTGKQEIASGFGIVTIYDWIHREKINGLNRICTLPDYIGMILTGKSAPLMDATMAHSIGSFDRKYNDWDAEILKTLEIEIEYFPRISPSFSILGSAQNSKLRLKTNSGDVMVSTAIGDNQASFIGSVKEQNETVHINIGTGAQISCIVENYFLDEEYLVNRDKYKMEIRPFTQDLSLLVGSSLCGGNSYVVMKNFIADVLNHAGQTMDEDDMWKLMGKITEKKEHAEGLVVHPIFSGSRGKSYLRGSIEGINDKNFLPGNLLYATLEGITNELANLINDDLLRQKNVLVGSGNGLKLNPVLRRIIEKRFEKTPLISKHNEEAAIGAAIHCSVACGFLADLAESSSIIQYLES